MLFEMKIFFLSFFRFDSFGVRDSIGDWSFLSCFVFSICICCSERQLSEIAQHTELGFVILVNKKLWRNFANGHRRSGFQWY